MQALQEGSTAIDPQPKVVPFIFTRVMAPAIISSGIKKKPIYVNGVVFHLYYSPNSN